jgi:hypothetical protein
VWRCKCNGFCFYEKCTDIFLELFFSGKLRIESQDEEWATLINVFLSANNSRLMMKYTHFVIAINIIVEFDGKNYLALLLYFS